MKLLNKVCMALIDKQHEETAHQSVPHPPTARPHETYQNGFASFEKVYNELPQYLPKNQGENVTLAIAFLSVLNSATENRLRLQTSANKKEVFLIRKIEK